MNTLTRATETGGEKITINMRISPLTSDIYFLNSLIAMPTLFTRIIRRDIPSYTLYEDEWVYAFLDIFPQKPGHTLIVPKVEFDHFSEVPEPYYSQMFTVAKILSPAIKQATGCMRVCTACIGYEIPHCHYHLIPTNTMEDMQFRSVERAADSDLEAMQKKIISFLAS